ncbi:hypothetical protein FRC10_009152 [Ceratobasidium sp. 414]|nr:hypothetical protein FRC10_009152 [Ceratobasidium sp. 414]
MILDRALKYGIFTLARTDSTCRTIYLKSMVCSAGLTRVSCPQPGCGQVFKDEEVQWWGDGETRSRLKYLAEIRGRIDPYASPQTQATRAPLRDKRADERASNEYIQLNTKACPKCVAPALRQGDVALSFVGSVFATSSLFAKMEIINTKKHASTGAHFADEG